MPVFVRESMGCLSFRPPGPVATGDLPGGRGCCSSRVGNARASKCSQPFGAGWGMVYFRLKRIGAKGSDKLRQPPPGARARARGPPQEGQGGASMRQKGLDFWRRWQFAIIGRLQGSLPISDPCEAV